MCICIYLEWYSDLSSRMHVFVAGEVVIPPSSRFDTLLMRLAVRRCGYLRVRATTSFRARECFSDSNRPTEMDRKVDVYNKLLG